MNEKRAVEAKVGVSDGTEMLDCAYLAPCPLARRHMLLVDRIEGRVRHLEGTKTMFLQVLHSVLPPYHAQCQAIPRPAHPEMSLRSVLGSSSFHLMGHAMCRSGSEPLFCGNLYISVHMVQPARH